MLTIGYLNGCKSASEERPVETAIITSVEDASQSNKNKIYKTSAGQATIIEALGKCDNTGSGCSMDDLMKMSTHVLRNLEPTGRTGEDAATLIYAIKKATNSASGAGVEDLAYSACSIMHALPPDENIDQVEALILSIDKTVNAGAIGVRDVDEAVNSIMLTVYDNNRTIDTAISLVRAYKAANGARTIERVADQVCKTLEYQ